MKIEDIERSLLGVTVWHIEIFDPHAVTLEISALSIFENRLKFESVKFLKFEFSISQNPRTKTCVVRNSHRMQQYHADRILEEKCD